MFQTYWNFFLKSAHYIVLILGNFPIHLICTNQVDRLIFSPICYCFLLDFKSRTK